MSGAPEPLTPGDAARLLESAAAAIRAELSALSETALTWHPSPGEWCAQEVLGHLIESERRDCERAAAPLVEEFAALRRESVGLVAGLRAADLDRAGRHPKVGRQILANVQAFAWPHMANAQKFSAP